MEFRKMVLKNLFAGQQWGFPGGSEVKASACNAGDLGLIPGLGIPGEGMATHSSTLAWKIPWTEEPSELPCMGWQTISHNLSD